MKLVDLINSTRDQHFVSQAEQRLNSSTPNARLKNSKINRYEIAQKNPPKVCAKENVAVGRNLSFQEIFTIRRIDGKNRINFEKLFLRYEVDILERVAHLVDAISCARENGKLSSTETDLRAIRDFDSEKFLDDVKFVYKFKIMSGLRNPYCIKDTLKDFNFILNYAFKDEEAINIYIALELKNDAERNEICSEFNVSKSEYDSWIRLLLLFLFVQKDGTTLLDGFVNEFFSAKDYCTHVLVGVFDDKCALLTDTGIVKDLMSTISYMNITKNCVISLAHEKLDSEALAEFCRVRNFSEDQRKEIVSRRSGKVFGRLFVNDLEFLSGYNKICVQGAFRHVFSGSSEIDGVEILGS